MKADDKLFFSLILLTVAVVAGTVVTAAWIQSSRGDFFLFWEPLNSLILQV